MTSPIHPDTTVDRFLQSRPLAIGLLHALRIDYFCRTDRTLSAACADVGIELSDLEELLTAEEEKA